MEKKHFDDFIYAQYVAGCLTGEKRENLEIHLQCNCPVCRKTVEGFRNLSSALEGVGTLEPAGWRFSKTQEFLRRQSPATQSTFPLAGQVVFDSTLQPLPAGVRQAFQSGRQILYRAGDLELDVKIEKVNESQENTIIGQVVPPQHKVSLGIQACKVILREGERLFHSTYSNELGEFVFHSVPSRTFDLEVVMGESKSIYLFGVPPLV